MTNSKGNVNTDLSVSSLLVEGEEVVTEGVLETSYVGATKITLTDLKLIAGVNRKSSLSIPIRNISYCAKNFDNFNNINIVIYVNGNAVTYQAKSDEKDQVRFVNELYTELVQRITLL